jgi:perosamine synthetase
VFFPVHTMPIYSSRFQRHPVAEDLARRGINLPSFPALTDAEVERVAGAIRGYFRVRRPLATGVAAASTEA